MLQRDAPGLARSHVDTSFALPSDWIWNVATSVSARMVAT